MNSVVSADSTANSTISENYNEYKLSDNHPNDNKGSTTTLHAVSENTTSEKVSLQ